MFSLSLSLSLSVFLFPFEDRRPTKRWLVYLHFASLNVQLFAMISAASSTNKLDQRSPITFLLSSKTFKIGIPNKWVGLG